MHALIGPHTRNRHRSGALYASKIGIERSTDGHALIGPHTRNRYRSAWCIVNFACPAEIGIKHMHVSLHVRMGCESCMALD